MAGEMPLRARSRTTKPISQTRLDAILLLLILATVQLSSAYPRFFLDPTRNLVPSGQKCVAHPSIETKQHGTPILDGGISFVISSKGSVTPVDILCPGGEHILTLSFGSANRTALLNSNPPVVNFTSPEPTAGCPNQVALGVGLSPRATNYATAFTVPCSAAGSSILFKTTSVIGLGDYRWKYNTRTLFVADAASPEVAPGGVCAAAASTCSSLEAVEQKVTDPPQAPPPLTVAPPPPASEAANTSGRNCTPSTLGYTCMAQRDKVTVHWSVNTAAAPANPCTPTTKTNLKAEELAQNGALHMAVQSDSQGYVGLGFAENPGDMYRSDIVLGWVQDSGAGWFDTFHVTENDLGMGDAVSPSWAYDTGVVRSATAGLTTICFSRRLVDSRARASPDLREVVGKGSSTAAGSRRRLSQMTADSLAPALGLIWAISPSKALVEHRGNDVGGFYLDLATGEARPPGDGKSKLYWINVHGALMAVAWGLLLPLGALLPAHRWILGDAKVAGKHVWFWSHMVCQWTGMALFIAGFVVAFTKLSAGSEIVEAHENIGIAIMAAAGAQVVLGYARPSLDSPHRGLWNMLHHNLGRATVLLAWANVYIGIYAYHTNWSASYAAWITPIAIVMGLLVLADITLRLVGARRLGDPAVPPVRGDVYSDKADGVAANVAVGPDATDKL